MEDSRLTKTFALLFHKVKGSIQLIFSRLFSGVLTLVLTPIILKNANATLYGLFIIIASFAIVLGLLDLGVGNGIRTRITAANVNQNDTEIQRLITSALYLVASLALGIIILGLIFTPLVPWQSLVRIPNGDFGEFKKSISIAVVGIAINLVGGLAVKLNFALSNIRSVAIWDTFSFFVTSFFLLWLSSSNHPLEGLVFGQLVIPGIVGILNLAVLFYRNPKFRPKGHPKFREMCSVLASGKLFIVLEATTLISFQIDSLIVGHYLEPRQVSTLATSWRLFSAPLGIASAALIPLWAATAKAKAAGDQNWIRRAFIYSLILSPACALPCSLAIIFYGKFAIKLWTHNQIIPSSSLIYASAIWLFIASLTLPFAMMLNGLHASRFLVVTAISMTAVNVLASIYLTGVMKDPSAPLFGSILAQIMCFLVPLFFWSRHKYFD